MGSDTVISRASWNIVRLSLLLSSLDLPPRVKRRVRFLPLGAGQGGGGGIVLCATCLMLGELGCLLIQGKESVSQILRSWKIVPLKTSAAVYTNNGCNCCMTVSSRSWSVS